MIYILAFIAAAELALLGVVLYLALYIVKTTANNDQPTEELVEGGMNLNLLKPKPKPNPDHKARRFTDKSKEWLLAHDRASRR